MTIYLEFQIGLNFKNTCIGTIKIILIQVYLQLFVLVQKVKKNI